MRRALLHPDFDGGGNRPGLHGDQDCAIGCGELDAGARGYGDGSAGLGQRRRRVRSRRAAGRQKHCGSYNRACGRSGEEQRQRRQRKFPGGDNPARPHIHTLT